MRLLLIIAAALGVCTTGAWANMLTNPGFEDPITMDGPPFVGFWEGFSGGGTASATNASDMPHSGAQHLSLSIDDTDNTFAGAFQDVAGITPGMEYTYSGFNLTTTNPLGVGIEVRIEWRDSINDVEIARTPNLSPTVSLNSYSSFMLNAIAPAGSDTARVVYAIETFSIGTTGTVYVDDVDFSLNRIIPEPSSAMLLLGGVLVACHRRGRANRQSIDYFVEAPLPR